jgi:hypothetical protein
MDAFSPATKDARGKAVIYPQFLTILPSRATLTVATNPK